MLMDLVSIVSLLGLLIAIANLAVDVVALVIAGKKEKRSSKRPPPSL